MRIKAKTTIRLQHKLLMPGEEEDMVEMLAKKLIMAGLACPATPVERDKENATSPEKENSMKPLSAPKHLGGGWYQLEDGSKVRKSQLEGR